MQGGLHHHHNFPIYLRLFSSLSSQLFKRCFKSNKQKSKRLNWKCFVLRRRRKRDMAVAFGSVNGGSWVPSLKDKKRSNKRRICCPSASLTDQYRTLQIQPGASESEVKKAFRSLALQYHPDVCKGSNCGVQFHQINEAYDILMSNLREKDTSDLYETYDQNYANNDDDESTRGMYDPDWDLWEEWMGWEGAGIRDYTSHINPYI